MKSNSRYALPVMVQMIVDQGRSEELVDTIIKTMCPYGSCCADNDCTECWEAAITASLRGEEENGTQEHGPDDHTDVDQ